MANKQFQTLKVLPTFTSTRIPAQTDEDAFAANVAALADLPVPYLKAISVISLAYQLKANGGYDYITALKLNQLVQDARTMFAAPALLADEQSQQVVLFRTVLDWNGGYTATTTLSTDPNVLIAVMPGLLELPIPTLDMCAFMLRLRLAV